MRGAADAFIDLEMCRRADLHLGTCGSLFDQLLHHARHADAYKAPATAAVGTQGAFSHKGAAYSFMYNIGMADAGAGPGTGADDPTQGALPRPFCGTPLHQQQLRGLGTCGSPCAPTG